MAENLSLSQGFAPLLPVPRCRASSTRRIRGTPLPGDASIGESPPLSKGFAPFLAGGAHATHHYGMDVPENLFLVGFMGSGKSTVGQQLAAEFGKDFHDCDRVLEERTGVDIPYIFEIEGEKGFRRREAAVLRELTRKRGIVLATGGGAIVDPENRKALASNGFVIYLHAPAELLYQRTSRDRSRPMLHAEDLRARIDELLEAREPLYREVADFVIETGRRGSRRVVQEIIRAFPD